MDLTEAMRTAGCTRLFRPESVSDEVLYRVLDNARFAPSGGNRQGWRVIVIREQALRARLKELYLRSWRPLYPRLLERAANDIAITASCFSRPRSTIGGRSPRTCSYR